MKHLSKKQNQTMQNNMDSQKPQKRFRKIIIIALILLLFVFICRILLNMQNGYSFADNIWQSLKTFIVEN